ncbi:Scopoletin glucosyltransferase [Bienertia sinuspersici]
MSRQSGMLKKQLERYLHNVQPDCLVADMFLSWATDCATKFDIPRLELFTIPNLSHEIRMKKLQILENLWKEELKYTFHSIKESEFKRRKAWHIDPISLCNRSIEDKVQRGEVESRFKDNTSQLYEIAMALEASQQEFIWVAKEDEGAKRTKKYFPPGFEQRNEGKD